MGRKFKGGYIGQLDESQQAALTEMHKRFAEWKVKVESWENSVFQIDDRFLLKFLRARDFDVAKATDMLNKHLEYREKWTPHKVNPETDPEVQEALDKGIWRLAGVSKAGHPIQLIQVALFLPKEVKSDEQYIKNCLFHRESTLRAIARDGWKVETGMVIFDMAGWSLFVQGTPSGLGYVRMLIDIVQNHYPENLEKAIIFNAPFVFRTAWAIIRPWLDPATAERVIFVTDPAQLREIIDADQLNERYGGTKKEEYEIMHDWMRLK